MPDPRWTQPTENYWRLEVGAEEYVSVQRRELDREDRRRYHWSHRRGPEAGPDGRPPQIAEGGAYALAQAIQAAEASLAGPAAGFVVVRDEDDRMVCDWDGEIHPDRKAAEIEMHSAQQQEPLYEWHLAEVRPTEVVTG